MATDTESTKTDYNALALSLSEKWKEGEDASEPDPLNFFALVRWTHAKYPPNPLTPPLRPGQYTHVWAGFPNSGKYGNTGLGMKQEGENGKVLLLGLLGLGLHHYINTFS